MPSYFLINKIENKIKIKINFTKKRKKKRLIISILDLFF